MPELWIPGAATPSIDDFVERVHRQIARFAGELPGGEAQVELELRDGLVLPLESIVAEPGYGFVTLRPHGEDWRRWSSRSVRSSASASPRPRPIRRSASPA